MTYIVQAIVDMFNSVISPMWTLTVKIIEWVVNFVLVTIPNAVFPMLPEGLADFLNDLDLQAISDVVAPFTWFIPVWAILKIYSAAYAMAAVIRLIRWVIGFVPTIEG